MADLTTNLELQLPGFGELAGTWGTSALNTNFVKLDDLFGSQGHNHSGPGSGGVIDHQNLLNIGALTHVQLEAAITALQQRVDEDSEVGQVRRLNAAGAAEVTVTDVSSIDFVNCLVEQTAAGFVKVTPEIPQNSSYEVTAPVNYFDAFTASPGLRLDVQSWSSYFAPEVGTFNTQGTGNGIEARPEFSGWLSSPSTAGSAYSEAGVAYVLDGAIPHSEVQRVSAVVERAEFAGPAGTGVSERIQLQLGILTRPPSGGVGNPDGLFLLIDRTGSSVSARFLVLNSASSQSVEVVDGTSQAGANWSGKAADFLLGQHEMSLSKDSVTGRYWLHYYYNKGLIYKYEEPVGGSNPFFDEVRALLAALEADPSTPDFGQFSLGALFRDVVLASDPQQAVARPLYFHIDSFMASSVGERLNPKFISSGYSGSVGGSGDEEVCPTTDPNPYEGVFVNGPFIPAGGNTELTVLYTNNEFFVAEDPAGQRFEFYCAGAGGGNGGNSGGSGEGGGEATVDNELGQNNVQVGLGGAYATTTFTADVDIPANWTTGNLTPGEVIAAGDPLPNGTGESALFISGQAVMANENDPGSEGALGGPPKFNFATGKRLPLGTKITANLDVSYDATSGANNNLLSATFQDLIEIVAVLPSNVTTKAFVYRGTGWQEVDSTVKVREGDGVALTLSGKNIPMPGFWEPSVGFGKDYRINNNENCQLLTSPDLFEGDAAYFTAFESSAPAQQIVGDMPAAPVAQGNPSDTRPAGVPAVSTGTLTDQETVLVVGRISRCVPASTGSAFAKITFTDYQGAEQDYTVFDTSMGETVTPEFSVQGTLAESTAGATVDVLITYPNPQVSGGHFQIQVPGGVAAELVGETYGAVNDPGPGQPWSVVATLTFDTGAAETFTLLYNDGCRTGSVDIEVTNTTPPDPPTPNSSISESALYQCAARDLTFTIPASNVTAGDTLNVRAATGTCVVSEVTHVFTTADATNGYSSTLQSEGIVGQVPAIEVQYTRPGANNASAVQTLTLGLQTPLGLTITGETAINFAEVDQGVLTVVLDITPNAGTPWTDPGYLDATVSGTGALGGTVAFAENDPASQNGSTYTFLLDVGEQSGWQTGDTITLTVPNDSRCVPNAGTTDHVITLTVNSSITVVRSGQGYNRFPFNIIIEGATAADVNSTVEVIDINQNLLQDLGTIGAGAIFTTGGASEARLEGIWDIASSNYGPNLTEQIDLFVRITSPGGQVVLRQISKTASGGSLIRLSHGYLQMPPALEIALAGPSPEFVAQLPPVSEGSEINVLTQGDPLSFLDLALVEITGSATGTTYTPDVAVQAEWIYTNGEQTSVPTNIGSETSRRLGFFLNPGDLAEGQTSGFLSLTLKLVDQSDSEVQERIVRTYTNLIPMVPTGSGGSGGGGPVVGDMSVGS